MIFKQTHRATTVMREAFDKGLRSFGRKLEKGSDADVIGDNHPAWKIADAMHANAGVYRCKDVEISLTTKTYKQLARAGVFMDGVAAAHP